MRDSERPTVRQKRRGSVDKTDVRLTKPFELLAGTSEADARRHDHLNEMNSLVAYAADPLAASKRVLEYIVEEARGGLSEEGERHIRNLCSLWASAEARRLVARTERELGDMFDLYHQIHRELRELHDSRSAVGVLARSTVPQLADVCLVDLAEDRDRDTLRRSAVEASHLVPDAGAIKAALATVEARSHAPAAPRTVVRTGSCRIVSDVSDEDLASASSTEDHLNALRSLAPTSYVCVPLTAAGSPAGAMTLLRARPGKPYSDSHVRLAQAIGELYDEASTRTNRDGRSSSALHTLNGVASNHSSVPASQVAETRLTPRELEVLLMMHRGYNRKALANELNISKRTYDTHSKSIREKLQANTNLQALAAARAMGLVHD